MVRTIDRYVIREVIPPFLLSLLILTFLLVLPPVMEHLEKLLAKGVSWTTAARIIWTAVPQAAGLTIPMSLLVGLLVGLGRLSADREAVALLACGVSPYRLLQAGRPDGPGRGGRDPLRDARVHPGREPDLPGAHLRGHLQADRAATSIPGSSFRTFPGWVLYARDEPDPGSPGLEGSAGHEDRRGLRNQDDLLVAPWPDGHQPCRAPGPPGAGERQPVLDHQGRPGRYLQFPRSLRPGPQPGPDLPGHQHPARPEREDHPRAPGRHAGQDQERHLAAPGNHHDPAEVLDSGGLPGLRAGRPGPGDVGGPGWQAGGLRRRDCGDLRLLHRVPAGRVPDQGVLRQSGSSQSRRPLHGGAPGAVGAEHHARPVRAGRADLASALHRGRAAPPRARRRPSPVRLVATEPPDGRSGRRLEESPQAAQTPCRRDPDSPSVGAGAAPDRPLHQPHLPPDRRPVVHGAARALLHLHVHRQVRQDFQGPGDDRDSRLRCSST